MQTRNWLFQRRGVCVVAMEAAMEAEPNKNI